MSIKRTKFVLKQSSKRPSRLYLFYNKFISSSNWVNVLFPGSLSPFVVSLTNYTSGSRYAQPHCYEFTACANQFVTRPPRLKTVQLLLILFLVARIVRVPYRPDSRAIPKKKPARACHSLFPFNFQDEQIKTFHGMNKETGQVELQTEERSYCEVHGTKCPIPIPGKQQNSPKYFCLVFNIKINLLTELN